MALQAPHNTTYVLLRISSGYCSAAHTRVVPTSKLSAKRPPHSEPPASTAEPIKRFRPWRSVILKPPIGEPLEVSIAGDPS